MLFDNCDNSWWPSQEDEISVFYVLMAICAVKSCVWCHNLYKNISFIHQAALINTTGHYNSQNSSTFLLKWGHFAFQIIPYFLQITSSIILCYMLILVESEPHITSEKDSLRCNATGSIKISIFLQTCGMWIEVSKPFHWRFLSYNSKPLWVEM